MKVFAKFDEIPSMILEVIKETKRYGHTFGRSFVRSFGQRENSIPSHKHSLHAFVGGYKYAFWVREGSDYRYCSRSLVSWKNYTYLQTER